MPPWACRPGACRPASRRTSARSRAGSLVSHPARVLSHDNPSAVARKAAQAAVPTPVMSPLSGTIGMLARRPMGEIRLKFDARTGSVMTVAATVMASDSGTQRRTAGTGACRPARSGGGRAGCPAWPGRSAGTLPRRGSRGFHQSRARADRARLFRRSARRSSRTARHVGHDRRPHHRGAGAGQQRVAGHERRDRPAATRAETRKMRNRPKSTPASRLTLSPEIARM